MTTGRAGGPVVAILPAGSVAEDWLEPLSLPVGELATKFSHAWFFAWAAALHRAGGRGAIMFVSSHTTDPVRLEAPGVPATIWILPEPRRAARVREAIREPRNLARRAWNSPLHRSRGYLSVPVREMGNALRVEGCTALVCQDYELPRFDVCILAARRLGVPVLGTFQGTDPARAVFERWMHRLTVPRAAGLVIGVCPEAQRVRARYGVPQERMAVLPNPVDTDFWRATDGTRSRCSLGIPDDALVVAWHGRAEVETKGLDLLLDAWPAVRAAAPEADRRLILLGSGPDTARLRRLVTPLASHGVSWCASFLSDAGDVRALLESADVHALTSRREGIPSSGLEAMSCELPLVITKRANRARLVDPDVDGAGGIEVEESSRAIADGLNRLLGDDELRARMGAAARRRAVERFSLDRIGPELRDFIEDRCR
jgi:glycosyltransferase involved in cell wall biosynthesis